jgi:cardiolipin synthase (CMP-forming)
VVDARGRDTSADEEVVGNDIYSVANMITILRLLLVPFFFTLLVVRNGRYSVLAFVVFAVAASTDFLDGMIARRTGTVTAFGKVIDPLVDRALIASGVVGLYVLDRLPLWAVIVLLARDLYLLYGAWVLERNRLRMPVLFIGKATTAVLLTAFSALILGPAFTLPGGITPLTIGTALLYVGIVLSLTTAVLYSINARRALATKRADDARSATHDEEARRS